MKKLIVLLILGFTAISGYSDEGDSHDGSSHDSTMRTIDFESVRIRDPEAQLQGRWYLGGFDSTDAEMLALVRGGDFIIWLDVYEDYLQVSVQLRSSGKIYKDPPVHFEIVNERIILDNRDFLIGLTGTDLVLSMLVQDQIYRYNFRRKKG